MNFKIVFCVIEMFDKVFNEKHLTLNYTKFTEIVDNLVINPLIFDQ